jgi:hypothetical protein
MGCLLLGPHSIKYLPLPYRTGNHKINTKIPLIYLNLEKKINQVDMSP